MDLTVVSFNMKGDVSEGSPYALVRRQQAIRLCLDNLKADIIGTQELTIRGIADLKNLLPDYQWVGLGRNGGSRGEFTALFYNTRRLTCIAFDTFWLGKRPAVAGSRAWTAAYPRICTWGIFREVGGNCKLAVYNTHLDHLSRWARKQGIIQITNFIRKMNTGFPTILMGDFNAYPQTPAMQTLKTISTEYHLFAEPSLALYFNGNEIGRTYHAFRGLRRGWPIDYIFTSPEIKIKEFMVDHQQYDGRYPSDHYPLVMKIQIGETV